MPDKKLDATVFKSLNPPEPKPKKANGRPRWEPDETQRRIVLMMAGFKIPVELIALAFGLAEKTLRRACKHELTRGPSMVYAQMAANMMALSQLPNGVGLRATESILQMRFGWSKYAPPLEPKPEKDKRGKKEIEQDQPDNPGNSSWARSLADDPADATRKPN